MIRLKHMTKFALYMRLLSLISSRMFLYREYTLYLLIALFWDRMTQTVFELGYLQLY